MDRIAISRSGQAPQDFQRLEVVRHILVLLKEAHHRDRGIDGYALCRHQLPDPRGRQLRFPLLDQAAVDALRDASSKILVKRLLRRPFAPTQGPRIGGKKDLPDLPFFPADLRRDEV